MEVSLTFTLKEIADLVNGQIIGDEQITIKGINSLQEASHGEISFFADPRYTKYLETTTAAALLVPRLNEIYRGPQIIVPNPTLAYARVAGLFAPSETDFSGISPQAIIQENSRIGKNVTIYPFVYIGREVIIGDNTILFPGVFIGDINIR